MSKVKDVLSSYDIHFEKLFEHSDLKECFRTYLIKVHNEEPFLFLEEQQKYVDIKDPLLRYKCAERLVLEFINRDSPKELNIGNRLRQETLNKFEQSPKNQPSISLFDDVKVVVYMELKEDSLLTFTSSKLFEAFVVNAIKKDQNYLLQIGTLKAKSDATKESRQARYNVDKFEVTNEDFDLIYNDLKNGTWRTNNRGTLSVSTNRKFINSRGLRLIREVQRLPFDCEEVFNTVMGSKECSDKIEKYHHTVHEYFDSFVCGNYLVHPFRAVLSCSFPMVDREFCGLQSVRRQPDGSIIAISKSVVNNILVPANKDFVRAFMLHGQLFENRSGGYSVFSTVSFIDMCGFVNPTVFNQMVKYRTDDKHHRRTILDAIYDRRLEGKFEAEENNIHYLSLMHYDSAVGISTPKKSLKRTEVIKPYNSTENLEGEVVLEKN
ncbi:RGS1 [Acrasis kona]|uniref:RGS1 n=1 Tax=Acrasis kona TaxID=1008807 RepID=A0AAW2YIX3_9EUKA